MVIIRDVIIELINISIIIIIIVIVIASIV